MYTATSVKDMHMKNDDIRHLPIGVLDSGLGGISVLRELRREMPGENYIYYGDSANAPYGEKTRTEIMTLCEDAVEKLISHGVKAVVIACNTATSVAAEHLREKHPDLPIIGEEPALKPAMENYKGGICAVMATNATLKGKKFLSLLEKYSKGKRVVLIPAPRLVEFVESGIFSGNELNLYIKELFSPLNGEKPESVVLGCTHFPFIAGAVSEILGKDVAIYDGGRGAALQTKRVLDEKGLLSSSKKGTVTIENSLGTEEIKSLSEKLLER